MSEGTGYVCVMKRGSCAVAAFACVMALGGCAAMQVKLGMKVDLAKVQATTMQASLPKGPGVAPGEKSPLVVTFTEADGKTLTTEGQGHGKVMWKDLTVTATVVAVNQKGIVTLPRDPRVSDGKVGHVTITAPSHPDLKAEMDIAPRYNYKFSANFSGSKGMDGTSGFDGIDGAPGSIGSLDPNNPSPGGNGGDGTDGSSGGDGGPGGDAPAVQVRMALKMENRPLLQVSVTAAGKERFYLVDPQGGTLTVKADGGDGGSGGKGGRRGRGGSGGAGTPNGNNGRDGSNGMDGQSGPPGRGGSITVMYDPQVKPYLAALHLSNQYGPKPVFEEQAVGPLW